MTGFVIPYETHQTDSRVWVAWWAKDPRPPLALRVRNLNLDVLREIPLDGGWSSIGLEGAEINEAVCQYQVVTLNGLERIGKTNGLFAPLFWPPSAASAQRWPAIAACG